MKTVNSTVICSNELHKQSILIAFANIPTDQLKIAAQRMRERLDWYGEQPNEYIIYNCMLEVIHIAEPDFETKFIPAI